jgi:hypothetical protein
MSLVKKPQTGVEWNPRTRPNPAGLYADAEGVAGPAGPAGRDAAGRCAA